MDIYSAIVTGDRPPPHFLYRSTQWRLTAFVNRKVLEKYGPLPAFTHTVVTRIMENKLMPKEPDHLLVNEYNAGQGIMPHTGKCVTTPTGGEDIHDFDVFFVYRCTCSFRSCHSILVTVISLCNEVHSRGERKFSRHPVTYVQSSTTTMDIINADAYRILARRSMLVMTGDARYLYKHSISKDLVESSSEGVTVHRDRRVSFTFRGMWTFSLFIRADSLTRV